MRFHIDNDKINLASKIEQTSKHAVQQCARNKPAILTESHSLVGALAHSRISRPLPKTRSVKLVVRPAHF